MTCILPADTVLALEIEKLNDDDDVYLDKLQTRGVKKSIVYMWNVDYSQ
jgi:hypothetical protein